jgi:peptidoglycan/LPS O-acetylase OafA/YrhL
VPVVAFHAGFDGLAPGGFIGVDIFFVISGYLITGIIFREINNRTFSIRGFYSRRIRRIFPALYVVYIACMVASLSLHFPQESETIGKEIISSTFFISNIVFDRAPDYFAGVNDFNPLLHTWSLSVEEQFYVLFPLLAFAISRLPKKTRMMVICAFAIASFGWSTMISHNKPAAAFFPTQSRGWELLIGAYLALAQLPVPKQRWLLECAGLVGLMLIGGSIVLLSPASLIPAPSALGACLGAALLIYSGSAYKTVATSLLSAYPLRFVGLISYSLYLWHWPIICFVHYLQESYGQPIRGERTLIVAASFLIAFFSWWCVERPFRRKTFHLSRNATIGFGGALMLTTSLIALFLGPINRMIWQPPKLAEDLLLYENYHIGGSTEKCFLSTEYNKFSMYDKEDCLRIDASNPNYLLLGDSHAAHLWTGLQETYPGINFLRATASGCIPILRTEGEKRCTDLMQYILGTFLPSEHLDGVILSARWSSPDVEAVLETSAFLSKHVDRVIISGPIQEYDLPLPRILATAVAKRVDYLNLVSMRLRPEPLMVDRIFASSMLPDRVVYVSTYRAINAAACNALMPEGVPAQFDYGHLTKEGSRCVAKQFGSALSNSP